MSSHLRFFTTILHLLITIATADEGTAYSQYYPPPQGGYVSPAINLGQQLPLKHQSRPPFPASNLAPTSFKSDFERLKDETYNLDELEKVDVDEAAPILSIVIPSLFIGLVRLIVLKIRSPVSSYRLHWPSVLVLAAARVVQTKAF